MARLASQGVRARRRKRRARMLFLIALLVLVVCGGAVWLFYASFTRITTVAVSGVTSVGQADVEELVRRELTGSYFFIAPKDSIFFYPKSLIAADLHAQFPAFKSVAVHAADFTTLEVEVAEREPHALWCGANTAAAGCMLMDESGIAYAPAAEFTGSAYVRYVGPMEPLGRTALPVQYLTEAQYRALAAFVEEVGKTQTDDSVEQVVVDEANDVHVYFQKGFMLLFVLGDSSADVYERFVLALEAEPFTEHTLEDFQYLDLRFGDELYYKLKE